MKMDGVCHGSNSDTHVRKAESDWERERKVPRSAFLEAELHRLVKSCFLIKENATYLLGNLGNGPRPHFRTT